MQTEEDVLHGEPRREVFNDNYYFDNEVVERLLHEYVKGACTDVRLRDEIMVYASELINQIIKAHNLGRIYPGKDDSSIMDLFQTAWLQIESMIYKYEAFPHCAICYNRLRPNDSLLSDQYIFEDALIKKVKNCPHCRIKLKADKIYYKGKSKVFNLYSQVARTVILAYIKKENRDRKNSETFKSHLGGKLLPHNIMMERFFEEVRVMHKDNEDYMIIVDSMENLYKKDERLHEGLVPKLVAKTGFPRETIMEFLISIRSRSHEITDAPINQNPKSMKTLMGCATVEDEY